MIDREHELPITKQAQVLRVSLAHNGAPRGSTRPSRLVAGTGPSTPFPGFASAIEVGEKSLFEKYRPNVKIEPTPDECRVLHAAHLAAIALRRTFDHWVTVGRGLQLLRQKADQIGSRNAFNDLRD
jgi:hypothetical protein